MVVGEGAWWERVAAVLGTAEAEAEGEVVRVRNWPDGIEDAVYSGLRIENHGVVTHRTFAM